MELTQTQPPERSDLKVAYQGANGSIVYDTGWTPVPSQEPANGPSKLPQPQVVLVSPGTIHFRP